MDKLPQAYSFPEWKKEREGLEKWLIDFQSWIEKALADNTRRTNWLLDATFEDLVVTGTGTFGALVVDTDTLVVDAVNHTINGTNLVGDNTDYNLFLGTGAFANAPGRYNIGVGYHAGFANIDGNRNVFIGANAGERNEGGDNNFFLGAFSGKANVSGNSNVCIGNDTGIRMTAAHNNTYIGTTAGVYNKHTDNVAIGKNAGRGVDGSSLYQRCTMIGNNAGYGLTTGLNNIFFGYKSGYNQTTLSNLFIVDRGLANASARASAAAEITDSILYGVMADAPANQTLRINASTLMGDLTFVSNAGLSFGEIYAHDNTTTMTLNSTGPKVQIVIFDTNGENNNVTPDHTNDHITITKAGIYLCNLSIAILNGAGSSHKVSASLYKNNGATEFPNVHANRDLAAGTDIASMSLSGIIDLTVDDTIEVWLDTDRASNSIVTVEDITLSLVQIGG